MLPQKKSIAIIGGGASALMLCCSIDTTKYDVILYEKNNTLARKFLVAGKGGFNLTHSEPMANFITKFTPQLFLNKALNHFTNTDMREWLKTIGISTYVGSSKRVFPAKDIKPIQVLNAIIHKIKENNVVIKIQYEWKGFIKNKLVFKTKEEEFIEIEPDITIFALGGSSWKITGSCGTWVKYFTEKNITINPFYPSNCAYKIKWADSFIKNNAGKVLKNCEFTCGDKIIKGEAVITNFGIEGSGIYPLSNEIKAQLLKDGKANVYIDFKSTLSIDELLKRFKNNEKLSVKDILVKKINLSELQVSLIKHYTSKDQYHSPEVLCKLIKSYPLQCIDFAPIDEAISTTGGIALTELNQNFELKKMPHTYCIGEMLDYDAPTGGYLLQSCFSTGKYVANYLNGL